MRVVDRFASAVILTPDKTLVKSGAGKIVRVPGTCALVSGGPDGILVGADRRKVSDQPLSII